MKRVYSLQCYYIQKREKKDGRWENLANNIFREEFNFFLGGILGKGAYKVKIDSVNAFIGFITLQYELCL